MRSTLVRTGACAQLQQFSSLSTEPVPEGFISGVKLRTTLPNPSTEVTGTPPALTPSHALPASQTWP
ncbi:hypothetical protein VTO73DRAFT_4470 [Trametes versicolor]